MCCLQVTAGERAVNQIYIYIYIITSRSQSKQHFNYTKKKNKYCSPLSTSNKSSPSFEPRGNSEDHRKRRLVRYTPQGVHLVTSAILDQYPI